MNRVVDHVSLLETTIASYPGLRLLALLPDAFTAASFLLEQFVHDVISRCPLRQVSTLAVSSDMRGAPRRIICNTRAQSLQVWG